MLAELDPAQDGRWPKWVFGVGEEPDYRFSFANERTFLAWIRTAIALIAGGVALHAIELELEDWIQRGIAAAIVALGMVCAVVAWIRWASAERAIRQNGRLPPSRIVSVVAGGLVVLATALVIFL